MPSRLSTLPVLGLSGLLRSQSNAFSVVQNWTMRRRTRVTLSRLDVHLLRDIGLSEGDAMTEIEKPFWR